MRSILTCAAIMGLACSTPAQQSSSMQKPTDTAARVGDRVITIQDLDDQWNRMNPTQHREAVQQIYEGRKAALDAMLADMLLERAARAQGMEPAAFRDAEIARRAKPVTDPQVASFYEQNKAQMQNQPLASISPVIRRYLEQQQRAEALRGLIAELRKSGPPMELTLDPPRDEIAIEPDDPVLGSASAPVTLVEFSDFQCPFCQRVVPTIKQLHETYGDRVRIVWKDFPLTQIHPQAFKAAEAGRCANEQGEFWNYHDRLFGNQHALEPMSLKKYAADAGLDEAKFNACLDSGKYAERVRTQINAGNQLGIGATPTSFVNGRAVRGAQPYETFAAVIDEELERAAK